MVAAMVVILNQGSDAGRRDAVHQPATEPATTPDGNAFGQEINGQGKVFVAGPNGVAGWVYTKDLNYDTRPEDFRDIDALNEKLRNWAAPVHDDSGNVIGYWVTNGVGFVDLATYNSPDYDPDALREQRGLSTTRQLTP
jgi:hypothetical protein